MQATELLQYAAQKNIGCVQFGDNLPLHLLSDGELEQLRETSIALGIKIEVGTRRLTEENIWLYLSIAKRLSSSFLRVVIDDAGYHPDEKAVVAELENLLPHSQKANIILAIENHDRFSSKTLERIIKNTSESLVAICLDTANSLGAGEGFNEVLNVLAPYTINLHIKDITIKRLSHKMGFFVAGCAAGQGLLNIPEIIGVLKQYQRCQTATLEVWSQPEETIEKTVEKEKQWVEYSIDYLKNLLP